MPADDLLAEPEEAATELAGFSDFRVSEIAREDRAAFGENRQRGQVTVASPITDLFSVEQTCDAILAMEEGSDVGSYIP